MEENETVEPVENEEEVDAQEAETDTNETDEAEGLFDAEKAQAKIRKANSENRNLRKAKLEAEEKAKAAEGSGEKITALEAQNLRLKVALKHGLNEDLIDRLKGDTEEELLEDAEKLLNLFGTKRPPTDQPREKLRGGGDPTTEPSGLDDLDKFAERIFRN